MSALAAVGTPRRGPGGIVRWDKQRRQPACIECDGPATRSGRCGPCDDRYQQRLRKQTAEKRRRAETNARNSTLRALGASPALRAICPDCDTLTYLGETCVCVRLWCRRQEETHNQKAVA